MQRNCVSALRIKAHLPTLKHPQDFRFTSYTHISTLSHSTTTAAAVATSKSLFRWRFPPSNMTLSFRIMVFSTITTLAMAAILLPVKAMNPRNLETTTPATTTNPAGIQKTEIKCGSCPCGTNCYDSPPPPIPLPPVSSPPPLPPPSPPPPSPPPPSPSPPPLCPPPPPPTPPPSPAPGANCPPPPPYGGGGGGQTPPDNYLDIVTGPPKDLYPVVPIISAARRSFTVAPPLVVLSGLMGVLVFW